jgi:hypothetical protein
VRRWPRWPYLQLGKLKPAWYGGPWKLANDVDLRWTHVEGAHSLSGALERHETSLEIGRRISVA